jgi:DUF3096 family protein
MSRDVAREVGLRLRIDGIALPTASVPDTAVAAKQQIWRKDMTFTLDATLLQPVVALLAGILILLIPRILNYVVALYLIFVGVTGLWPHLLTGLAH